MIVYRLHKAFSTLNFHFLFEGETDLPAKSSFHVSYKSIFLCEWWDGFLMEYLLSLGIFCLIGVMYFDWEEKLEAEHLIFLFVRFRAGKFSECFRKWSLECAPFFVTDSVFSGGQRKECKGWQWLGGHSSFESSQYQKIRRCFGMKLDISGFNNAISNKSTTENIQSLPLSKDNVLLVGAKAEPAKFLSLLP